MEQISPWYQMIVRFIIGLLGASGIVLLGCAFGGIAVDYFNVFLCRQIRKYRIKHKDDE